VFQPVIMPSCLQGKGGDSINNFMKLS